MDTPLELARQAFFAGLHALQAGRWSEAETHFQASLQQVPDRPSTLANLGVVRLNLGRPAEAVACFDRVLDAEPNDLDTRLHRGSALAALGRDAEALIAFDTVLAADPQRTAAHWRRALALGRLGRHAEALAGFDQVVAVQPQHAEAWLRRGQALQALDRHDEALPCYERATALDPTLAEAWSHRGVMLKDRRQLDEAATCFRQALAHGGDAALNGYFLASVADEPAPPQAPGPYVRFLFDDYAAGFDRHLVEVLHYRAPQVLAEELAALGPGPLGAALDLGCGTGLVGAALRPRLDRLDGIDLAPAMLQRARERGVYDELVEGDVVQVLARTPKRYRLVLSADVFIYIGELEPVFAGVARVLEAGGLFAFSVEQAAAGERFELRPSSRYAHPRAYLESLAARRGFEPLRWREAPLREDQRRPVPGLYVVMRRA